jgi:hypothetical protein
MADFCEHRNEPSHKEQSSKFHGQLRNYQLFKEAPTPVTWLDGWLVGWLVCWLVCQSV